MDAFEELAKGGGANNLRIDGERVLGNSGATLKGYQKRDMIADLLHM